MNRLQEVLTHNPTFLLLLALAHAYIFLTKILIHKSTFIRLFSVIPSIYIFFIIPWSFPSALIRGTLSYFVTWITSFKILAHCFRIGPDQVTSANSFLDFVIVAVFPFKLQKNGDKYPNFPGSLKDAAPLIWLITVLNSYIFLVHKHELSNMSAFLFYSIVTVSWLASNRVTTRFELVPLFEQPYSATSLQQFWGKKWNKYSSFILRLTVYDPIRKTLNNVTGTTFARLVATLITLAVSGMMHEVMLYYITCGKKPTWEGSWYFVLQGMSMGCESLLKYLWLRVFRWPPVKPMLSMLMVDAFVGGSFYVFIVIPVSKSGQNYC